MDSKEIRRKIMELHKRICHRILKLWLQPIRVFCIHHVCAEFDVDSMNHGDWMQIDAFKQKILSMRRDGVAFISLPDAYCHLSHDMVRCKKFAVLTFDDGYASLKEILPWLDEQHIPATLFLNPAYMDGKHYRRKDSEQYLTVEDVNYLIGKYSLLTIGSHGWEHLDATKQSKEEFTNSVSGSVSYLSKLPNYIPFFAYAYGYHNETTDSIIANNNLVPVCVSGNLNYHDGRYIDRLLLK